MNIRILYIEDDATHLKFFKYICAKENEKETDTKIECETAESFGKALELLSSGKHYDICLTDIGLDGYLGSDLVEKFPEFDWFVITAMTKRIIEKELGEHPLIKKIFYKPCPKDELLEELENFVKLKKEL